VPAPSHPIGRERYSLTATHPERGTAR